MNNTAEIFIYLNMNVSNLAHLDETDRFFFVFEFCTFSSSIFFRHTDFENLNIRNEILTLNASDFAYLDETDIFFRFDFNLNFVLFPLQLSLDIKLLNKERFRVS